MLLKNHVKPEQNEDTGGTSGFIYNSYRKILNPFLERKSLRWILMGSVAALLVVSFGLAFVAVPLKILPFDNKNEFQIVVNMPENTTLETTDDVVRSFERYLANMPEVRDYQSYVGTNSPMDFNGMVRHYYLREGSNVADIRINLAHKKKRVQQSHSIILRIRDDLQQIADQNGARIQVVEAPLELFASSTISGEGRRRSPIILSTKLVAGAKTVMKAMEAEKDVVDIDLSAEAERERFEFVVDKEKAALHGITTEQVVNTLYTAISGSSASGAHMPHAAGNPWVRAVITRAMLEP
ncbi:MAG: efflux RND transporter permease subunit [Planctomycetota bacterium]|nr:efflux RND transporter permease subunit [Planctomycetota bacterium]